MRAIVMRTIGYALCGLVSACGYFGTDESGTDDVSPPDAIVDATPIPDAAAPASICTTDADCGVDVCSALGRCAAANTLRTISVRWTADSQTATEASCAEVFVTNVLLSLAVEVGDPPEIYNRRIFGPIPCPVGQSVIENVPPEITMVGYGHDGFIGTWQGAYPGSLSIDWTYLDPNDDDGGL